MGLGGKATITSRGSSLKSFIKDKCRFDQIYSNNNNDNNNFNINDNNNNNNKAKKNMCFRLPTVPKFRSPTLLFLLSFLVFYNIDSSRRKMFSVTRLFLFQLMLKLTLL